MRVSEQVLEATDNITPRSALRYRPIAGDSTPPPIVTTASIPVVQRASRPRQADVDDEVEEWQRVGRDDAEEGQARTRIRRTSAVSKTLPKTPRPNTTVTRGKPPLRLHPLLYLGVGMIVMLVFWTVLTLAISWFNATLDDIRYGRPRTFQIDAVVGHNDSAANPSHFIAINLNRHIEIIELPGGDAARARIYTGPQLFGAGDELTPVTLRFVDVNGDHLPDMIVSFQGTQIVFINDQGGFRPLRPEERQQIEQFLQRLGS